MDPIFVREKNVSPILRASALGINIKPSRNREK